MRGPQFDEQNCDKLLFDAPCAIFENVQNANKKKVLNYGIYENLKIKKSKSTVCF